MDDLKLLSRYLAEGSQDAFAELLRRNVGIVYSSARRQLNDAHLAEDVTQAVFMLLARKGRSVKGSVSGWLVLATWYTCRDARKLETRRKHHERQAGAMKLEQQQEPENCAWESYAPAVDAAMARLSRGDRDVIALRYLRGMQLKEAADCLGISEEAARKRSQRGLERLRTLIKSPATAPAVAVLAQQLAARGAEAAPQKLIETILAGPAAKGTAAACFAGKAAGSMLAVKLKVAATVLLIIGAAGGAAGTLAVALSQNTASPSAQANTVENVAQPQQPAVAAPELAEKDIPGHVQLAFWEAVFDDAGAAGLKNVLTPVNSDSKVYNAMRGNGHALRDYVNSIRTTARFLNLPDSLGVSPESADGDLSRQLTMLFSLDRKTGWTTFGGHSARVSAQRTDDEHLQINVDFDGFVMLRTAKNWTQADRSPESIVYDGTLQSGDAVAFLADLKGTSGKTLHHLIVWETFNARPQQMEFFSQHDVGWWCDHGPEQLRPWADAALAWRAQAKTPATQVPPEFEKSLSDEKTIKLIGVARFSQGPFCWWNATGDPVSIPENPEGLWGDPGSDLKALVEIAGQDPDPEPGKEPASDAPFREFASLPMRLPDGSVEVGVLVGPWTEVAQLQPQKTVKVDRVSYRVADAKALANGGDFTAHFSYAESPDCAVYITAIGTDGSEVRAENYGSPNTLAWRGSQAPRQDFVAVFRDLRLQDVKYFRLLQRKRQWVRFAGIALEPKAQLPGASYIRK
jgi:RNA polymerase sigma factor (sigma-70 family)